MRIGSVGTRMRVVRAAGGDRMGFHGRLCDRGKQPVGEGEMFVGDTFKIPELSNFGQCVRSAFESFRRGSSTPKDPRRSQRGWTPYCNSVGRKKRHKKTSFCRNLQNGGHFLKNNV